MADVCVLFHDHTSLISVDNTESSMPMHGNFHGMKFLLHNKQTGLFVYRLYLIFHSFDNQVNQDLMQSHNNIFYVVLHMCPIKSVMLTSIQ